jgi:hypothetical protein
MSIGMRRDNDNSGGTPLRILHASPDAPNVDIYIDSGLVLANVPYPTASNYLAISAGAHNIKINAAGTSTMEINVSPSLASRVLAFGCAKRVLNAPA